MTLRVVNASEPTEALTMSERIERLMRQCIAANPNSFLVIWEANGEVEMRCEPAYPAVALGMLDLGEYQVKDYR